MYTFVVDELRGIAIAEIVVAIVDNLAVHLATTEYEIIKKLAADETDKGGSARKKVFTTQIEVNG